MVLSALRFLKKKIEISRKGVLYMTFLNLLYYFCTEAKTILTETSACDIKNVLFKQKKTALLRKR